MNFSNVPKGHEECPQPDSSDSQDAVGSDRKNTHERIEAIAEPDMQKLRRLREEGKISPHDFPYEVIFYFHQEGYAILRRDLGMQAIVLTRDQLEELQYVDLKYKNGREMRIETENMSDSHIIIFPDELGD